MVDYGSGAEKGEGKGGKGDECYTCGESGHKSWECPKGKGGQKGKGKGKSDPWVRGFRGYCDCCGEWGHSKKYCKWWSGMRPMWEESEWYEGMSEEESNMQQFCLREEEGDEGGLRTLEQDVSEEEATKMN